MNPGDQISRYRIIARAGKGGMGEVYRAEDLRLDRQVALKFLPRDGFTEQSKNRFLNEARAAAKVRHPNICPIHDIEEADGELFLVMAYIEGETLQRRIDRGPLPPAQVVDIGAQVASGLACAHGLGIVHRDIKSANIMVDGNGNASILDFGLALAPDSTRLTGTGISVGTPGYMSPEQIEGRAVDARTDLWSLGIVMYEMLTGELPFQRERASIIIHAILNDPLPPMAAVCPDAPAELQRVIEKALAKDAAERWQSAAEMAAELKRVGRSGAVPFAEATDTQTIVLPSASVRRPKRRWAAAATVIGLLAAGAGYGLYRAQHRPPAAVSPAAPAAKLVAVLPFEAEGAAGEARTVADGLVEILSEALGDPRLHGAVTPVAPSDLARRKITNAAEARRMYGVDLAITGAARQAGETVAFTVNLVDAATGRTLGSRSFIYDPKAPLVSRNQAVVQVAGMMNLDVPAAVSSLDSSGGTAAPGAFPAYLEGRGFLARRDLPGNIDKAISSFSSAIRQDPNHAPAYAGLAEAYWRKASETGDKKLSTLANQNAEYAVHLDGNLAMAHAVLGNVYLDAERQQDAVRELQRAMELAPTSAEAPRKLAEIYETLGRFNDAEALYIRSTKSRPTDWYGYLLLGVFYYHRERYAEAEAALNQAKALTPDNEMVREDLAAIYRMHGRYQDSIAEYQEALRIRKSATSYAGMGGAYYQEHRFQEAVAAVEAALDLDATDYRFWGNLGSYCRWAPGKESESVPALKKAIEMATRLGETKKSDYAIHANLAEYRARLGDAKGALAEIDRIPQPARRPFTARLAIVYELTGHRDLAIEVVRANLKSAASLNQIKDDPDLAAVWREGRFQ